MVLLLSLVLLYDAFHSCLLIVFLHNLLAKVTTTLCMVSVWVAIRAHYDLA